LDGNGNKVKVGARIRGITLSPEMKFHLYAGAGSSLGVAMREYALRCATALNTLRFKVANYIPQRTDAGANAAAVFDATVTMLVDCGVVDSKGPLTNERAKGHVRNFDCRFTYKTMLGTKVETGNHVDGVHCPMSNQYVVSAGKIQRVVANHINLQPKKIVGDNLNITGRVDQDFVRNRCRLAMRELIIHNQSLGLITTMDEVKATVDAVAQNLCPMMVHFDHTGQEKTAFEQARCIFDPMQDILHGAAPAAAPLALPAA